MLGSQLVSGLGGAQRTYTTAVIPFGHLREGVGGVLCSGAPSPRVAGCGHLQRLCGLVSRPAVGDDGERKASISHGRTGHTVGRAGGRKRGEGRG